jgi:hypothetical protein
MLHVDPLSFGPSPPSLHSSFFKYFFAHLHMATSTEEVMYLFGQHSISWRQVFFKSRLCLGIVNIMPAVPGHVLVIPTRSVIRFKDLTTDEVSDLFFSAQIISRVIEPNFNATSMTLAVQVRKGKEGRGRTS